MQSSLSAKEISLVMKVGRKLPLGVFIAFLKPADKLQTAILTPKRLYKRAVDRNYLRRVVRACLSKSDIRSEVVILMTAAISLDRGVYSYFDSIIKEIQ